MDIRSRRLCDCVLGAILWLLGPAEGWCREDCNRNGISDSDDLASSLSRDCNANGVPDECEHARVRLHSATEGWRYDDGVSHETVTLDFNHDHFPDLLTAATRGSTTAFTLRLNDRRGGFDAPQTYAARDPLIGMLTTDLDGDDDLDVVAIDRAGLFWLDHMKGAGLSAPRAIGAGGSPQQVIALDINADDLPDLITADGVAGAVSILENRGGGTFPDVQSVGVGGRPAYLAPADFNGDGTSDLAVLSKSSRQLSILTNNDGSGEFQPTEEPHVVDSAIVRGIAVGDVDADGDPDPVVIGWQKTFIFTNQGDGVLSAPSVYPLGARSIASADLDGDGALDFMLGDYNDHKVTLLLNAGDGRFYVAGDVLAPGFVENLAPVDLDRDSDLDLVVTTSHEVAICSQGDEFLAVRVEDFKVNQEPHYGAVRDFDDDGNLDLVTADGSGGSISILHGTGDGGLTLGRSYWLGGHIFSVESADLDADGDFDIVAVDYRNQLLLVFRNLDEGDLGEPVSYPVGRGPAVVILPDLDGDGHQDMVTADAFEDQVTIYFNGGDGSFTGPLLKRAPSRPVALSAADLNGDGLMDLAVANATSVQLTFLWGDGNQDFQTTNLPLEAQPVSVVCADADDDGVVDVFVASTSGNAPDGILTVFHNDGAGGFQAWHRVLLTTKPSALTVCSLNRATPFDLIVTSEREDRVTLFQGSADGKPRYNGVYSEIARSGPRFVTVADLDDNRHPDMLVLNHHARTITVLRQPARELCNEPDLELFLRGDANADGKANITDPLFTLAHIFRGGRRPVCLKTVDVDDNGRLNLLDPLYALRWLLVAGPPPPTPASDCGFDSTEDSLSCEDFPPCN